MRPLASCQSLALATRVPFQNALSEEPTTSNRNCPAPDPTGAEASSVCMPATCFHNSTRYCPPHSRRLARYQLPSQLPFCRAIRPSERVVEPLPRFKLAERTTSAWLTLLT